MCDDIGVMHDCGFDCVALCGGSSSSSNDDAQAERGRNIIKAVAALTAFSIGITFAPAHTFAFLSKDGKYESADEAREKWKTYKADHKALEQQGKLLEREEEQLHDALRDAPGPKPVKKLKPFNPPRLRPNLQFECNRAGISGLFYEGPLVGGQQPGIFRDEADMLTRCAPFFPQPQASQQVPPQQQCNPNQVMCRPSICCPTSSPVYNPCDGGCYRNTEFRGSTTDAGRHCDTAVECNAYRAP